MKRISFALALLVLNVSVVAQGPRSATICSAFPCIVASVSLSNQGQGIPATAIFTPSGSGVFRISSSLSTTTGTNQNATWEAFEGWTDDIGPRQGGFIYASPNINTSSTWLAQVVAGQPILYQTKLYRTLGGSGGMTYNLHIIVEQLE